MILTVNTLNTRPIHPRPQKPIFCVCWSLTSLLPPITYIHNQNTKNRPHQKPKRNSNRPSLAVSFSPFSRLLFPGTRARGPSCHPFELRKVVEKILSRHQKSPTWTLRLASPSLSASSHQHIGTAIPRLRLRQLLSQQRPNSPNSNQPDGKVNTLLSLPPLNFLLAESNATAKKRSISHVKKNVTAVPVSSKRSSILLLKNAGMSSAVSSTLSWHYFEVQLLFAMSFFELSRFVPHQISSPSAPSTS